jgi:hypothetical protein
MGESMGPDLEIVFSENYFGHKVLHETLYGGFDQGLIKKWKIASLLSQ